MSTDNTVTANTAAASESGSALGPFSLERGLQALREEMDAPTAAFFSSCVHCGLCAQSCPFFVETGDPKYTPIHKLEPLRRLWEQEFTLWGKLKARLGFSQPIDDALLEEWEPLLYDSCSMCGRCSLVCPVGNDIQAMVRKTREGMVASGHSPEGLIAASVRAVNTGSPMGLQWKTLDVQIGHVESASGLTVPIDQAGADYLVLLSSMEIINFPEYLEAIAKIFAHAGVSWTLSKDCFEATNAGVQIGSKDIAAVLVRRVVDAAVKLGVKNVISPECGHAYTGIRWEGPNVIGQRYPFKVFHIIEVLDQLRADGRLRTEGMETDRLSMHDPCNLARKSGVIDEQRNLMKLVAEDFVDMKEHGKYQWCCGAGGGVSSNERAEELKMAAFRRKKAQIEEIRPDRLVTMCATCRTQLEEGLEEYTMDIPVVGLTEMIAEHLVEDAPPTAAAPVKEGAPS
ncbi:(Fe-S)-binding protein [Thiorhodovibrio frisius]|uniref:Fe-S oxidoreductase n=1 Tax=Thiorhodovibrio frisius TaxID=631362 RepID=H8YX02_9GAMM|nr:heterodisulfide reductase-related iron-sulfur binding cluster [Thiorhodovibrio frisius]EIC22978.1 Fe-S oxidoreductase [Thiorhodovibrio frisius]WPL22755.1 succinate dehydrogenase/fumarate reductase iron-sulfur subunit [Thiorhodovibrio frisius]